MKEWFSISELETEGRKLLLKDVTKEKTSEKNRLLDLLKANDLKNNSKERMSAKLEVINLWNNYYSDSGESKTASQFLFVKAYNSGDLPVNKHLRMLLPTISQPSLCKWIRKLKEKGMTSLAGNYGNRKGQGIIDSNPKFKTFIQSLLKVNPSINGAQIYRVMITAFEPNTIPNARTIERWLRRLNIIEFRKLLK